jgi:hypothetical protein
MAGITQTVLINSEPIAGYRGKISNSNSLLFGQSAGTSLNPGDTSLMSSLNMAGLEAFNSDSWTIEYWVRHTNIQFDEGIVHINGQAILGSANFVGGAALYHTGAAVNLNNYLINNAIFTISTQTSLSQSWGLNEWYHVAMVKTAGANLACWVNGHRSPEGEVYSPNNYSLPFSILASWRNNQGAGTTNNLIGNLYNLRILNAVELYDTTQNTISIPIRKLSVTTNTNLLLLAEKNATLTDSAANATLSTRAGTTVESLSTPFNDPITKVGIKASASSPFISNGSGSYYFYGNVNSYGTYAGNAKFALGTSDFCLEWFGYAQGTKNTEVSPWWYETSSVVDLGITFSDTGSIIDINIKSGATTTNIGSLAVASYYKQWLHWAIVRISGSVTCYCNGVALNPGGDSFTADVSSSSGTLYLGKKGTTAAANECFFGYLTNLRLVKGIGVYSGNFTMPTYNLQRFQFADPYGGSNTAAIKTDQTAFLMVP